MVTVSMPEVKRSSLVLIGLLAVALVVVASLWLPPGIDWRDTYRPATRALLSGDSPYSVEIFFAPPWSLIPLIPLAFLPVQVGRAVLFLVSIVAFAYVAHRIGAKPLALAVFLFSPPVLHCLLNANIEWLPLLGFVLPPQIGLLFVLIKPQIGFGVALFWAVEAWREGGLRAVAERFWPLTVTLLVSLALYGLWPIRFLDDVELVRAYNASLWPYGIPVGLALLFASFRRSNVRFAMGAWPFLSPVVLLHAWSGTLVSLASSPAGLFAAVVGLWVLVLGRMMIGGW